MRTHCDVQFRDRGCENVMNNFLSQGIPDEVGQDGIPIGIKRLSLIFTCQINEGCRGNALEMLLHTFYGHAIHKGSFYLGLGLCNSNSELKGGNVEYSL